MTKEEGKKKEKIKMKEEVPTDNSVPRMFNIAYFPRVALYWQGYGNPSTMLANAIYRL